MPMQHPTDQVRATNRKRRGHISAAARVCRVQTTILSEFRRTFTRVEKC